MFSVYKRLALAVISIIFLNLSYADNSIQTLRIEQPKKIECKKSSLDKQDVEPYQWNGWGNGLDQKRFQSSSISNISLKNISKLKLLWAYGFSSSNKVDAQPTVIGNVVYSSGGTNLIHAIDLLTGCKVWSASLSGRVRTAIVTGEIDNKTILYFGDQNGIAYAYDALNGKKIWEKRLDNHPLVQITGSPVLFNSVVYFPTSSAREEGAATDPNYPCCTFRGSLSALKANDGSVIWKTYTISEVPTKNKTDNLGPSGAGIWSSPAIDVESGTIYVGTGNNFSFPATNTSDSIMALSIDSGSILWVKQITPRDTTNVSCYTENRKNCPTPAAPDYDFASSVIIVKDSQNRKILLAGQKSGVVTALDPDKNGEVIWQKKVGNGSPLGGIQYGMTTDGKLVYAAISYISLQRSTSSTKGAQQGHDGWYFLDSRGGGLHALDIFTGELKWTTPHPGCKQIPGCSQAQSAALTSSDDFVLSGGMDGVLRAYASENGKIVWEVDTKINLKSNNGMSVKGGSIDGPGPVIVNNMLLVTSGYQFQGGIPGNALLAFALE
jgi:polyvinyl alcohol dehydrogenase (cytochrome)